MALDYNTTYIISRSKFNVKIINSLKNIIYINDFTYSLSWFSSSIHIYQNNNIYVLPHKTKSIKITELLRLLKKTHESNMLCKTK